MNLTNESKGSRILRAAEGLADQIGNWFSDVRGGRCNAFLSQDGSISGTKFCENIESGMAGYILYLIELYKCSREDRYYDLISNSVRTLVSYCRENDTNNYSLYTGRAGVLYVLIQYSYLTGNRSELMANIDLIYPAGGEYFQSSYTSDGLYRGRSGTLLVIFHLYLITKESRLVSYINQFLTGILTNSRFSDKGISWKEKDAYDLGDPVGFGDGVSGIRYVLKCLNKYYKSEMLDAIILKAGEYIKSNWDQRLHNWLYLKKNITDFEGLQAYKNGCLSNIDEMCLPVENMGWGDGTAGLIVACGNEIEAEELQILIEKLLSSYVGTVGNYNGLLQGYAGIGCSLLEFQKAHKGRLKEDILFNGIESTVKRVWSDNQQGGLMNGIAGDLYFLLKTIQSPGSPENILFPFLNWSPIDNLPFLKLSFSIGELKMLYLAKSFPRTILFMQQWCDKETNQLLALLQSNNFDSLKEIFLGFVKCFCKKEIEPSIYYCLEDAIAFEENLLGIAEADKRSPFHHFLKKYLFYDEVFFLLNNSNEWLSVQKFILSSKAIPLQTKWNWSTVEGQGRNAVTFLENPKAPPSVFNYLLLANIQKEGEIILLKSEMQLLLQKFKYSMSLKQVITEITEYLTSLPVKTLEHMFPQVLEFDSIAAFYNKIPDIVMFQARYFILKGILQYNGPNERL